MPDMIQETIQVDFNGTVVCCQGSVLIAQKLGGTATLTKNFFTLLVVPAVLSLVLASSSLLATSQYHNSHCKSSHSAHT